MSILVYSKQVDLYLMPVLCGSIQIENTENTENSNNGNANYCTIDEINCEFSVLDKDDERVPLSTIEPNKGKETLGVVLAPTGSNDDAFQSLKSKASTWAAHIKSGHLSTSLTWHAATTTIMKSLEYPLPALTLSREQCDKIMKIVKSSLLPKSHISKNFPNAILYGIKNEGGLGLEHLYTTQGIKHIEQFVRYLASDTITGKLIRVSLEMCQLEVGIGRHLFTLDYSKFHSLLADSWIKHLWQFLHENNIEVLDRVTELPLPQREGDVYLMEEFQAQGYSHLELARLNKCRIFLRVLTLADVMT